jgi:hypothetical protein
MEDPTPLSQPAWENIHFDEISSSWNISDGVLGTESQERTAVPTMFNSDNLQHEEQFGSNSNSNYPLSTDLHSPTSIMNNLTSLPTWETTVLSSAN